jgi:BirA family biotin operon repressor/biotin-[acetyl-CoA-carboxylase] ligase
VVKEWGKQGVPAGAVLLARSQTAGRGRLGRAFYSPDSGLYFSILLRPTLAPQDCLRLTTAAAVAVAESIGDDAQIKWVNDIYLHGRKVCGILTESVLQGDRLDYAVVGIGLNLCTPKEGFPEELRTTAGGIFTTPPTDQQIARLVGDILTRFAAYTQDLFSPRLTDAYRRRNLLQGKTVTAGTLQGTVAGIDEDFALLLQTRDGQIHRLTAGEVSIGSKRFDL